MATYCTSYSVPKENAVFTRSNGKIEREAQRKFSKAQSGNDEILQEHKVNPFAGCCEFLSKFPSFWVCSGC